MPDLRKPDDWLKEPRYSEITILDPDGWDRKNFTKSWNTPIDREEFERRLTECTISIAR